MTTGRTPWAVVVAVVFLAVACAGSSADEPESASTDTSTSTTTPTTTTTLTTTPTTTAALSAENDGLKVTATPVSGLADGQEIEVVVVTDITFPIGAAICLEAQIDHELAACDLGTARELQAPGTTAFVAHRFLTVQNAAFDCAVESCVLGVAPIDQSAQVTVPLTFVGDEPVPDPDVEPLQPERVTTDVPEGLGFRELVHITIDGPFGPHAPSVAQCLVDDFVHPLVDLHLPGVDPSVCWNHIGWTDYRTDDRPVEEIDRIELATLLTSNWDANDVGPHERVDCRVEACELIVSDGLRLLDRVPLDFDPDVAWPAWAAAVASPSTYRPGDRVVIEATGLRPAVAHPVSQCVHFDRYGVTCVPAEEGPLLADGQGSGSLEVAPTEHVDGHPCAECWFWIFDPGIPEGVWQTRVEADVDLVVDP